jgi:hypothetical protein
MIGPSETSTDPFGTLVSLLTIQPTIVLCCSGGVDSETLWQERGFVELRGHHVRFVKWDVAF